MGQKITREKFVMLAERRVNQAIRQIKLIGNLSNKRNYAYTDSDAGQIYRALKKSLDDMRARFESSNEE